MPIQEFTRGRRIMVAPNALVGPYGEGTVLSEEYLSRKHNADLDHILRNGGAIRVSDDTPLSFIVSADLAAPLVNAAYPVAGGHREPAYLNSDGSPMAQGPTPNAAYPAPGQVPDTKKTEPPIEPPLIPSPPVAKTDKEVEPPLGESVTDTAVPKGTEPVDLEAKPGTGVNTVADETDSDNAHRTTGQGRSKGK